jgi:hypothetical protein
MTKTLMTSPVGFAMPGFEGNRLGACMPVAQSHGTTWRGIGVRSIRMATSAAVPAPAAAAYAQNQNSLTPVLPVATITNPAVLPIVNVHDTVTKTDAGRGNKGSSPWRFPA